MMHSNNMQIVESKYISYKQSDAKFFSAKFMDASLRVYAVAKRENSCFVVGITSNCGTFGLVIQHANIFDIDSKCLACL